MAGRGHSSAWAFLCDDGDEAESPPPKRNGLAKSSANVLEAGRKRAKMQKKVSFRDQVPASAQVLAHAAEDSLDKENGAAPALRRVVAPAPNSARSIPDPRSDLSIELAEINARRGAVDEDEAPAVRDPSGPLFEADEEPAEACLDKVVWVHQQLSLLNRDFVKDRRLATLPGVVDCIQELLVERIGHLESISNMAAKMSRLSVQVETLNVDKSNLLARLDAEQREIAALTHRISALEKQHKEEAQRWAEQKHELTKTCSDLRHRDGVHRAGLRKKEVEYQKLKDMLQRDLRKNTDLRFFEISSLLGASSSLPPSSATLAAQDRESMLEEENGSLREDLEALHTEFAELRVALAKYKIKIHGSESQQAERVDWHAIPERIMGMPVDWLRSHLGDPMAEFAVTMKERVQRIMDVDAQEAAGSVTKGEYNKVVQNLRNAQRLITKQELLLESAVFGGLQNADESMQSTGGLSGMCDEEEQGRLELAQARRRLERQCAGVTANGSVMSCDLSLVDARPDSAKVSRLSPIRKPAS